MGSTVWRFLRFALLIAIAAGGAFWLYNRQEPVAQDEAALVAARALPAYHIVAQGDFACNEEPGEGGADPCAGQSAPLGEMLLVAVAKGDPVPKERLAEGATLSQLVELPVLGTGALLKQIEAGDRVDVYLWPGPATEEAEAGAQAPAGSVVRDAVVVHIAGGEDGYHAILGLTGDAALEALLTPAGAHNFYLALRP